MTKSTNVRSDVARPGGMSRRDFAAMASAALVGGLGLPSPLVGDPSDEFRAGATASADVFDLRITILGLCLSVRDHSRGQMHVLMPSTHMRSPINGRPIPQHHSRLIYDSAYERRDSSELEGRNRFVPLENGVLDLTGIPSANGLDLTFPFEVVDLDPIVQERVKRNKLGSDRVISRLTIGGGSITAIDPGRRWTLGGGGSRHMATAFDWTIPGIPGDQLRWVLSGLRGSPDRPLPHLYPIDGMVQVQLYYTPADELPPFSQVPLPAPGTLADHFAVYYSIYDAPARTPLPEYADVSPLYEHAITGSASSGMLINASHAAPSGLGLRPICMSATGSMEE